MHVSGKSEKIKSSVILCCDYILEIVRGIKGCFRIQGNKALSLHRDWNADILGQYCGDD